VVTMAIAPAADFVWELAFMFAPEDNSFTKNKNAHNPLGLTLHFHRSRQ